MTFHPGGQGSSINRVAGGVGLPPIGQTPDPRNQDPFGPPRLPWDPQLPFDPDNFGPPAPRVPDAGEGIEGVSGGRSGFLGWLQENQEIAGAALGTGIEAIGAHQEGAARDREFDENVRRYEKEQEREDERLRRRQESYQRILDRRKAR